MNPSFKSVLIVTGLSIAGLLAVASLRSSLHRSGGGNHVWFYDESEKRLYAMPDTTIPPDRGIGGPVGDGEKAVVVTFGKDWHDRSKWRIAYLQKYAPDLKSILDRVMIARAAHRIFDGSVPASQSGYFQSHTLVKRVDDPDWQPANSDAGRKILTEWRAWRGADGSGPVICSAD